MRTLPSRVTARLARIQSSRDSGMTTAEYAIGTVAACGFGGVLYKVITSSQVLALLRGTIERALQVSF